MKTREVFESVRNQKDSRLSLRARLILVVTGELLVSIAVSLGLWYLLDESSGQVATSLTAKEGYLQMPTTGVYVSSISGTNALDRLQAGDIITALDGLRITSIQSLISSVNLRHAGEEVTLSVLRDGAEIFVKIRLIEG